MQTIGIGELQKNMGILTNLTEPLTIVDKRKNKDVAVVYPVEHKKESVVAKLAGSLGKHTNVKIDNLDEALEKAMEEHYKEKYGFVD